MAYSWGCLFLGAIVYSILAPLQFSFYPKKATKFFEIFTLLLSVCTVDKSKMEISQNFVAFSEYTKFTKQNKTKIPD